MATKTALRNIKTGRLFPMNDNLRRHDDIEVVQLDKDNKVVEPEEVGPAKAMDLPSPSEATQSSSEEPAQSSDEEPAQSSDEEPAQGDTASDEDKSDEAGAKSEAKVTRRSRRS